MIALREKDLALVNARHETGRVSPHEVELAEIRLSQARIRLADRKGNSTRVIEELEALVKRWDRVVKFSEDFLAVGRDIRLNADAQVAALETRIRLIEAKEKYE